MAGSKQGSSKDTWDEQASSYDEKRMHDPVYMGCIDGVVQQLPKKGEGVCLDAGCGTGMVTRQLLEKYEMVVGADYSLQSLKNLKEQYGEEKVLLVQCDVNHLPFQDGVFSDAICANTMQHLHSSQHPNVISELSRVTRQFGRLVMSVHHYSRTKADAGWIKEGKPGQAGIDYIFRFTRSELKGLMPNARIRGAGFYGLANIPVVGNLLAKWGQKLLGRLLSVFGYGHMLIAICKNK